jgi:hypothetical protein
MSISLELNSEKKQSLLEDNDKKIEAINNICENVQKV